MRRASGSGRYYEPLPQYGSAETLEEENDAMTDDLKDSVVAEITVIRY